MASDWFVTPESRRIPLSDGQWISVKQRLTAGEYRAHLRRSSTVNGDGTRRIDPFEHALSLILAYLLDWSLSDATDIRGASVADLSSALDALSVERFEEIRLAIEQHEEAMNKEREESKKKTVTNGDEPISLSPSDVDGLWNGSAVSTVTTMTR